MYFCHPLFARQMYGYHATLCPIENVHYSCASDLRFGVAPLWWRVYGLCIKPVIDGVFHKLWVHGRRWKNACGADYTTLRCKRRWPSALPYVYGSSDDRSTHIPRWRRNSRTSRCHSSRQQTPLRDAHQPHDNAFQMRWRYIARLVRVVDHVLWTALVKSHIKAFTTNSLCKCVAIDQPTMRAGEGIYDNTQIQEARPGGYIGDVSHPELLTVATVKSLFTRSGAFLAFCALRVVCVLFLRLMPQIPISRIRRATRFLLTRMPISIRSLQIRGAP